MDARPAAARRASTSDIADRLKYAVGDGNDQDVLGVLAALLVDIHLRKRGARQDDRAASVTDPACDIATPSTP
jgi:hypothetical protein